MPILLGAVADDLTGASDLANTLTRQGMRAVLLAGVPDAPPSAWTEKADALVVALKSRAASPARAAADSLTALEWLRRIGARRFFFKYCSTFDSTPKGNIGPVADAMLDALGADFAPVCPAFPAAGRTVYRGHLFVGDSLLSDSPMREHPLNPMRDSNLLRLLGAQSRKRAGLISHPTVAAGTDAVRAKFESLRAGGVSYGVADALTDADLTILGAACADCELVTGGSGIASGLPQNFRAAGFLRKTPKPRIPDAKGRALILAGSCSEATRAQIEFARKKWPAFKLDADKIADGKPEAEKAVAWAASWPSGVPAIVYSSANPDEAARNRKAHGDEFGGMVERTLGQVASGALEFGARRIVAADGETAGAVVAALKIPALRIGPEIAPGVPWTETLSAPKIALALKSGNFGGADFFIRALSMLEKES